ncbi:Fc receptor-like protein 1 isoform X2 [Channa argus]|uniref:Fc receptor-like protein 1 isoform X2 n=1 Tax=Channa argus TaxID=215402 RepID=UPI00351FDA49
MFVCWFVLLQFHRHMRGAAMSLTAAASGFVVFLLSVSVIQGQNGWRVTYTSTQICAIKGSTVDIRCTYTYPSTTKTSKVEKKLWFTKGTDPKPVDLTADPDYEGRVEYLFYNKVCTLRIKDLRKSDSAVYKFRFITKQPEEKYTGKPGVTLSVTDLQMQVIRSQIHQDVTWADVKCLNSCPPDRLTYVWYKNAQKLRTETTSSSVTHKFSPADSYSCAIKGHEEFRSPSVYPPQLPSVSVSPSAEIVEGSSVTLTCSSDANPAANYTWFKQKGPDLEYIHEKPQYVFSSIQSSASGQYYCTAVNKLGIRRSEYVSINVKYPPKLPSVSVSPSAEIVEGSSVTLTCSSDANPAANYTWYKENEDSPKAYGQNFTITDIRPEHSGNYSCEAQNTIGRQNSTSVSIIVAETGISIVAGVTAAVLLPLLILLFVYFWMRKNGAKMEPPESGEKPENREQRPPDQGQSENPQYTTVHFFKEQTDPVYYNIRAAQPHRHMEEDEVTEYSAVRFNRDSTSPEHQETEESTPALYSTVIKT